MNNIHIQYYTTVYGDLIVGSYLDKLCLLDWKNRKNRDSIDNRLLKNLDAKFIEKNSMIIENTIIELEEYFQKQRTSFTIPLLLIGTTFQKKVWESLLKIPYGKTSTYLKQSRNIDNEKAVRAVANANGANAISIIVPCHRIIGTDGKLTGYAGGLESKYKLLKLENKYSKSLPCISINL